MHKALEKILEIQELDMQMIQLMHVKNERLNELKNFHDIREDLLNQVSAKEEEIKDFKVQITLGEGEVEVVQEKLKKLEGQQSKIKKVEEFNALSQEMSQAEREKSGKEQLLSDLLDKLSAEEELLQSLQESLQSATDSGKALEQEIIESISQINQEGSAIKSKRDQLVEKADPEVFRLYERLLKNKRNQVVVPIENRCCSGCHIVLTAQHENLVRKGERLVFCEHCSRIHYWQESEVAEAAVTAKPRRRRRTTAAPSAT